MLKSRRDRFDAGELIRFSKLCDSGHAPCAFNDELGLDNGKSLPVKLLSRRACTRVTSGERQISSSTTIPRAARRTHRSKEVRTMTHRHTLFQPSLRQRSGHVAMRGGTTSLLDGMGPSLREISDKCGSESRSPPDSCRFEVSSERNHGSFPEDK